MTKSSPSSQAPEMMVYRPRRKCSKCGLVNVDGAPKCRRCGQSFAGVNPGYESERLVDRIRARRYIIAAVLVSIVAGLVFVGVSYRMRLDRMSRYVEGARLVEADLTTLGRGATADARALLDAFDDAEVRKLLSTQSETWTTRAAQTESLDAQIADLVPQNEDQAAHEIGLSRKLSLLESASREIAAASRDGDVFKARVAATRLAEAEP